MLGKWVVPVIVSILILGLFPLNDAFAAVFIDSFDVSGQETSPTGLAFNTDGTKMFILGAVGRDVNEYACTAFDVSTCVYSGDAERFSVLAQEATPTGLAFNTDGTKMFVLGTAGTDVNEYACGGAFDVSTCAFTDSFSVAAQETSPRSLAFSADGTKMFVLGADGDDVNEYACTAFDVSTCAFTDSFYVSAQETIPVSLAFNTDGTKMFVLGFTGTDVNEYACTAFDVSTCVYSGDAERFSVVGQGSAPLGLAFSTDGTKMFVSHDSFDAVNEYSLGTAFDVSSVPPEEGGGGGQAIGGISIPIDTTALLVAGAQTISPWLILGVVSAVGIGLAVFTLKRNH